MKAPTLIPMIKRVVTNKTTSTQTTAAIVAAKAAAGKNKQELKIVSFNILAPCFLRMNKYESRRKYYEECKKKAKIRGVKSWEWQQTSSPKHHQHEHIQQQERKSYEKPKMESECKEAWKKRIRKIIQILKYIDADIMTLQEFWVENKEYVDMFEREFVNGEEENEEDKKRYELYSIQRPNNKQDGVATLINKEKYNIQGVKKIKFNLQGSRVALLLDVQCKKTGKKFIIANTHLTFPHHEFDRKSLRPNQVNKLIEALTEFQHETGTKEVILTGDFNTDIETRMKGLASKDPILPILRKHFANTAKTYNIASHLNHNDEIVGADYIFHTKETALFKLVAPPPLHIFDTMPELTNVVDYVPIDENSTPMASIEKVPQSYLFPMNYPSSQWYIPILDVSDHRPIVAHFSF
mmetsp:Transcript_10298/g.15055  ORF Transcript_10298/g.15055 Transcript_10298/m.15055 type:complete len:409 (+) Transcript_10298:53-1279(+)